MAELSLPVRPDLDALRQQAMDLGLDDLRAAEHAIALRYGAPSWQRLEQSCTLIDAIWRNDLEQVTALVTTHPNLLHENAGIGNGNWGPPLTYAANLGRDRVIVALHQLGATDLSTALERALLQGKLDTARLIHRLAGAKLPASDILGGPAYSLNAEGTALAFELGAALPIVGGKRRAPVDVVLETDARKPVAKHAILAMYAEHGFVFPDTPMMALHRGRRDLLEQHLRRDPALLRRTFEYDEIYPAELGCHDEWLPRTTLAGATLLHVCVEYDELELARWLLEQGMPVDVPAAVDTDGFGGQTALFHAVVGFPNFWNNLYGVPGNPAFTALLLEHGAARDARATLRERLFVDQVPAGFREHRQVSPLEWGEAYHNPMIVNSAALEMIRASSRS